VGKVNHSVPHRFLYQHNSKLESPESRRHGRSVLSQPGVQASSESSRRAGGKKQRESRLGEVPTEEKVEHLA